MKKQNLFPLIILSLLVPSSWALAERRQVIDEVVVSVDDEPMTSREISSQTGSLTKGQAQDIKALVANMLIEKEATKLGLSVEDSEVDSYVEEIVRQNQMTKEEFGKVLNKRGLDFAQYRAQIKDEILKSRVVAAEVRAKIQVTDDDIKAYFDDHPDMLPEKGSVYIYKVQRACGNKDSCRAANKELSQTIFSLEEGEGASIEQLTSGQSQELSDLGYLNLEDARDDIVAQVKDIEEGQSSKITPLSGGLAFYHVYDVLNPGEAVRGKLRDQIHSEIFEERFKTKLQDYISDELPARYFVDVK